MLSFFTGSHSHVVLKAKERRSLRPHGHIIRTGDRLVPDEASLTSTAWMDGVFHSLHHAGAREHQPVSLHDALLPRPATRSAGLRIFVELRRMGTTCSACRRPSR